MAPNFADDDALTYTASGLPVGLSISAAGTITGTLPADASVAGPYTITVTATDAQGATVTDTFIWTGTNPSPTVSPIADQSSVEGAAVNLDVAPNFADDDAITYTASGLPPGLSISPAGTIAGSLPANASTGGPYTVTITATDSQGASVSTQFQWTVSASAGSPAPAASFGDDPLYNVIKQFLGTTGGGPSASNQSTTGADAAITLRSIVDVFKEGSRTQSTLPLNMSIFQRVADNSVRGESGGADATLPITTNVVDQTTVWGNKFFDSNPVPIIVERNNRNGDFMPRPSFADPLESNLPSPDDRSQIFNDVVTLIQSVADGFPIVNDSAGNTTADGFKNKLRAAADTLETKAARVSKLVP